MKDLLFIMFCWLVVVCAPHTVYAKNDKVVLELYTSHGCPACPPADKLFNELADSDELIALSFHVDYWDSPSWKDPYSSNYNTKRQQYYPMNANSNSTYTPQVIIGGKYQTSGTNWRGINRLVSKTGAELSNNVMVNFIKDGDIINIEIDADKYQLNKNHDVWLLAVTGRGEDNITGGRNRGKNIVSRNMVNAMYKIGTLDPDHNFIQIREDKMPDADFMVVLIQEKNLGAIVSSGIYRFN